MRCATVVHRVAVAGLGLAVLLVLPAVAPRTRAADAPPALWLYCQAELAKDGEPARLAALWRRAAAAGYSRVVLTDPKFDHLADLGPDYGARAARVKRLADSLGLELVPALFPVGRSSALLIHHPDLAEALPVRDVALEVHGGVARVMADPPVALAAHPDYLDPGVTCADGVVRFGDHARRARFAFHVAAARFRCYHVSVELRTHDYHGTPMVTVLGDDRPLTFTRTLGLTPTQDWTRVDLVFDSLDHDRLVVWMGGWGSGRGAVEWRGWRIEEIGPVDVVRRADTPFEIAGRVEGRDYAPVRDTLLGRDPWPGEFRAWHAPPLIRTALPDGTRLRASWYMAALVYGKQVTVCPSEPGTLELLHDQATRLRALWGARGYLMMHDEIRALGWDPACRARGSSAGAVLAAHARDCVHLLAGARVYVWGDMFDPFQNAVRDFHLVRGDLAGSWEGLAPEVTIVNWDAARAAESLRFFAQRGHRQVIAAYYDGRPDDVQGWADAARGVSGVEGVMYTTWQGRYDDLEAFARAVRRAWSR